MSVVRPPGSPRGPAPARVGSGGATGAPCGEPARVAVEPDDGPGPFRAVTALLVAALTVAGGVLRFTGIGAKSLWIDEAFSVWIARDSPGRIWRTSASLDLHPPLYYTWLHAWLSFGDGEAQLRSLSALLSALTIPVVFLIGQRVHGRALGVLSGGLFALSPLSVMYAQQARMYAMMTLFAALSILSLLQLVGPPPPAFGRSGRRRAAAAPRRSVPWWALFVTSTALTMLSHNTAVLEPVAVAAFTGLVVLRSFRNRRRGRRDGPAEAETSRPWPRGVVGVTTGLAAALVLWLPWLPAFVSQSRRVDEEFWISAPTLSTVIDHWADLAGAFGPAGWFRILVVIAVAGLLAVGARQLRARPEVVVLLFLLLLVPVALELLISLRRPIFFPQTLVWTAVPFSVLLAAGVLRVRSRPVLALSLAALVSLSAAGLVGYLRSGGKEDWRGAVRYVAQRAHPQDTVLFSAAWAQVPFDYYYERSGGPTLVEHGLPTDMSRNSVLEPKVGAADLARLDDLASARSSIWVIYSHDWYTDPQRIVPSRLSVLLPAVESHGFPGIVVAHYRAGAG